MIPRVSMIAVCVFAIFVGVTLAISFYLGRRARSASSYFAAGGEIHWFINGVAFAGDYLSAASFLGICGMIATSGYDGFLYSIGYLAGWVVALLIIAEPMKRMGKFTFADALNSRFQSPSIKLAAGVSTLIVSLFYLIPQMVGAGALIFPLLGIPHEYGVILVGSVVVLIVVTAGMVSTTYVQFLKGGLLVIFSFWLTVLILNRGLKVEESADALREQVVTKLPDGKTLVDGVPQGLGEGQRDLRPVGHISRLPNGAKETGPLGPISFLSTIRESEVVLWESKKATSEAGETTTYTAKPTPGSEVLRPGKMKTFSGIRGDAILPKIDFISLMMALFGGTASLPHILIRYYTVKDAAAARKSTVVGIATIGLFYMLTLYMGLGAMTSGAMDVTNNNMAAPLLAKSFGDWFFAIISAIAFTTVLGTVSGLIVASSGAVVHDLISTVFTTKLTDHEKVQIAKLTSVVVGVVAIVLGILFKRFNVSFLVGWAFSLAASANLPALTMLLVWKGTTKAGVTASVLVGMITSLGWVLASKEAFVNVYGLPDTQALVPFSQPGIVTIPLAYLVLILVSLATKPAQTA